MGWVLAVPALVLTGAFDALIASGASSVVAFAGDPATAATPVTLPGLAIGLRFLVDYGQGRTAYQAFASYHAYLEFPVLLALLFGAAGYRQHRSTRL